MMGAARGDGDQGYNVGRNAALLAGFDHHVPACTLNRFCASSLQTIRMAFHAIKVGEGDQYVAAGVESVSHAGGGEPVPYHRKLDGSDGSLYDVYIPMGQTAENVARRCNVSREAQDEWAVVSQRRAVAARDDGHFDREIVPVVARRRHRGHHATTGRGPVRRPRSSGTSSPRSARTARSRPATRARSTTAPPPCS